MGAGSEKGTEATGKGFRPARVALGLTLFAALAALGALAAGWFDGDAVRLLDVIGAMPVALLSLALGLLVVDFVLGGLRLHVWLRRLEPGIGYGVSLRTYLVNLFAGAVSPMAAASGPAQLATLVKGGARPARAFAALLLTFVGILSALLLLGGASGVYLLLTTDLGQRLGGFERSLLVGAATSATLLVVAIVNPRVGELFAKGFNHGGERLPGRPGHWFRILGERVERGVADYRAALHTVGSGWKAPLASSFGVSLTMLLNKCAIGFLVALGLGFTGGYLEVASRHALQTLLLYFSPSPGASGLAEASVPAFMFGIIPSGQWTEFALIWRALTSYAGVAVGAVAVASIFGPRLPGGDHAGPDSAETAPGPTPAAALRAGSDGHPLGEV